MKLFWKRRVVLRIEEVPDCLLAEILSMARAEDVERLVAERRRALLALLSVIELR
jgi:hypothetical protein